MFEDPREAKSWLRGRIRARRRLILQRDLVDFHQAFTDFATHDKELFHGVSRVAAFLPMNREAPILGLLEVLCRRKIQVIVPRSGPGHSNISWGLLYSPEDNLESNSGNFWDTFSPNFAACGGEELPDLGPGALAAADVVLLPALALDLSGARLGQGGGWYDRALAFASDQAVLVGVVHPWEVLPAGSIAREGHDADVQWALTAFGLTPLG